MNRIRIAPAELQQIASALMAVLGFVGLVVGVGGFANSSGSSGSSKSTEVVHPTVTATETELLPTTLTSSATETVTATRPSSPAMTVTSEVTKTNEATVTQQVPTTVTESVSVTERNPVTVTETVSAPPADTPWPSVEDRDDNVAAGLARRGEVIGTGGKPAIALRFDHHLDSFDRKVLPLLRKYRLPWMQAINPSTMGRSDDRWTWEQLAMAAHESGGEVWNHAWSHSNFSTVDEADQAITRSLATLRQELPSLVIDGFAPPGNTDVMGMEGANTPQKYWDTYPGRLVLGKHAFVRGYFPGSFQPLDGRQLVGQRHITMDKRTRGRIEKEIETAVRTGTGLTLMLHPNYLDRAGYITTQELEHALQYIAHLRDTDQLEVLSSSGILMANKHIDEHHGNVLEVAEQGLLSGEINVEAKADRVLGVPHEAEVWMSGTGRATLRVTVDSPTRPIEAVHHLDLSDEPKRASVVLTPPIDSSRITVSIVGTGEYSRLTYQPV
ncbi:hypothetical protein D8M31_00205 [Corynebacterium genitalium]|nr:hypothetical protein D8M31_00205 [Corynebacterium genitalium]